MLKENHLIADSVLDVSSAKVHVFVQFCFENFHESVNIHLFLNSLLSVSSLMTFLIDWGFFYNQLSEKVFCAWRLLEEIASLLCFVTW